LLFTYQKNPEADQNKLSSDQVKSSEEERARLEDELERFATAKDATMGSPKLLAINYLYRTSLADIEIGKAERALDSEPNNERKKIQLAVALDSKVRLEDERLIEEVKPSNYNTELTQLTGIIDGLRSIYGSEYMVAGALFAHRRNIITGMNQS
jgi:hypothetical protein